MSFSCHLIALCALPLLAAPPCPDGALRALRGIAVDSMSPEFPQAAHPLLHQWHREVAGWCLAQLRAHPGCERDLVATFRQQTLPWQAWDNLHPFGCEPRLELRQPAPTLRLALLTAGVPCGADTTVFLFHRGPEGWQQVLLDEAEPIADVSRSRMGLQAVMTPATPRGPDFLATLSVNPWPTSAWQTRELKVWSVTRQGAVRLLHQDREGLYLGEDDPALHLTAHHRLTLRTQVASRDAGVHHREKRRAWRLSPAGLKPLPPHAADPRTWLEAWLDLPWQEARRGVDPHLRARACRWHRLARQPHPPDFAFLGRPGTSAPRVEVQWEGHPPLTFHLQRHHGLFYILGLLEGRPSEGR